MANTNPTLQQIQGLLLDQHAALNTLLDSETDPARAKAILMEMQEILHRVDLVQSLMFRQSSQQLQATLPGIQQSSDALSKCLASLNDLTAFLNGASQFLAVVDEAIDIAKALPLA